MRVTRSSRAARRLIGTAALAIATAFAVPSLSSAEGAAAEGVAEGAKAQGGIRLNWQDFAKDPAKVASLRKAVAVMKARNSANHASAEYRTSWEYWANIHGYFGPDSPFGTVADNTQGLPQQYLVYFKGVQDTTPPDQVAKDVWANCQHGTPWFFAWHRLYLLYFEKQLQAASGDPSLRLPYWDYSNPNQLAMPAAFIDKTYIDGSGKTQANPLYEARRAPGWLTGKAKLNGNSTNINSALKLKQFTAYQNYIEGRVHGYVHCTVGVTCPVVDMGSVPYSSNDPVFWSHHANIDRMWSCWTNISGNKNPDTAAFLNQQYSFVDTKGNEFTVKVGDLFNGTLVDYKYEQEVNCARGAAKTLVASAGSVVALAASTVKAAEQPPNPLPPNSPATESLLAEPKPLNAPSQPLSLTQAKTKVKITLPQGGEQQRLQAFALAPQNKAATETHLILEGISYKAHPGTMFDVFLENSKDPKKRVQVGTISFFTLSGAAATKHAEHQAPKTDDFDVTDALREVAGGKASLSDVTVSFEATTGREGTGEKPTMNADAGLTIQKISLMVQPAQ
ncbi:tyrosinase family protein [Nitrospirillum sp. BR 11163]|uniref:tyrosinase family protein n=1 Tax=Nitrospirillum sp. BR 11163 TaxID=3104323 RepID=UPI002AFFD952|nr:tyrosinase family protein [Nitrospirillum sp. BR 11163]MEA1673064.1 tyrosinase family protein [Nitrospirillum sp. BR 11163]